MRYLFGLGSAEGNKDFNAEFAENRANTEEIGKERASRLQKPALVEAVFMPSEGRQTICVSTQAGCAVDCHFCLTAQLGLIRNFTAGGNPAPGIFSLGKNKGKDCPAKKTRLIGAGGPAPRCHPALG